jgi:hypothetical protein
VAFDATGYVAHHASHYYALRTGRPLRRYAKLSAACEVPSLLYLAGLTGEAPAPERGEFAALLRQTWAQQPFQELLADAGYDGEANHRLAREGYGVRSLIPPTRGRPRRRPPAGRYRRRLARRFPRRAYGQRWLIETAFSQDKRRFGEALSARSVAGRNRQLRLRLLVHNLARLLCAGDSFQLSNPTYYQDGLRRFTGSSLVQLSGDREEAGRGGKEVGHVSERSRQAGGRSGAVGEKRKGEGCREKGVGEGTSSNRK